MLSFSEYNESIKQQAMRFLEFGGILFVGICVGLIPSFLQLSSNGSNGGRRETKHKEVFALLITIKFFSAADKQAFKELFAPFAQWVSINEPTTISYELSESDKDEKQIFITERYLTKNDYLEVHRKSPTFLTFRQKMADMSSTFTMEGHSYIESNIGFI